jgi:hypothetical protein
MNSGKYSKKTLFAGGSHPILLGVSLLLLAGGAFAADVDGDGMDDAWEVSFFSDLSKVGTEDTDSDGLNELGEYQNNTHPFAIDTDGDGLLDGLEVHTYSTDPLVVDSDGDGVLDGREVNLGTLPNDPASYGVPVTFTDANLDTAIRTAITKPSGQIYQRDLTALTTLNLASLSITDLAGLSFCTNLLILDVSTNSVSDLSPIAPLNQLTNLNLSGNSLSSLSSLPALPNLQNLAMANNAFGDISVLKYFSGLVTLNLANNGIDDIQALLGLTNLATLTLDDNALSQRALCMDVPALTATVSVVNAGTCSATDTDSDGLNDAWEIEIGTVDSMGDTDYDLLSDGDEVWIHKTNPNLYDTDGDVYSDDEEINTHSTDPLVKDMDDDGVWDRDEIEYDFTDPSNPDHDGDGLLDGDESYREANPLLQDTDADTVLDDAEVIGFNCLAYFGSDTDSDGLSDSAEIANGTNPNNADTDGDGAADNVDVFPLLHSAMPAYFSASTANPLDWATFLGGSADDSANAVAYGPDGNIYVVMGTYSTGLTVTPHAFSSTNSGSEDVYVAKFKPDGELLYATYIGGENADRPANLAFDAWGNLVISGTTNSMDLPNSNTLGTGGGDDAFVLKLSRTGDQLFFFTKVGGTGTDMLLDGAGLHVDSDNNIYVSVNYTLSSDFPTTEGAFETTHPGGMAGAIFRMNPVGNRLRFSTYIGGSGTDNINDLAVASSGKVYFTGTTRSQDLPLTDGTQPRGSGAADDDILLGCLAPNGRSMDYLARYGHEGMDAGASIFLDGAEHIYLSGYTASPDFSALGGGYQGSRSGQNAFVMHIDPGTWDVIQNALLSGYSEGSACRLLPSGAVLVLSEVYNETEVTPDALGPDYSGGSDLHLAILPPDLSDLLHGSVLGARWHDSANAVAVKTDLRYFIAGRTFSPEFPVTAGSLDSTYNNTVGDELSDGFLLHVDLGNSVVDSDGDGLTDSEESIVYGIDPNNPDTDGDFVSDFDELQAGTDPSNALSVPPDVTPPTALCADITVTLDAAGTAAITTADIDGGSADEREVFTLSASKTSFGCADLGPKAVTLTVTDSSGNTASCVATVTVVDSTAPTVLCQAVTLSLNGTGNATLTGAQMDAGSSDNCGITSLSVSQSAFTSADIGAKAVILTAADATGNTNSCAAIVTVVDSLVPIAICQPVTLTLDAAGTAVLTPAQLDGGSSDNVGIASKTASRTDFTSVDLGPNTVTLTLTDTSGNIGTCDAIVTVVDTTPPTPVCQDVTLELGAAGTVAKMGGVDRGVLYKPLLPGSVILDPAQMDGGSTDNAGISALAVSQTVFTSAHLGSNTITLTVTDIGGNTATCTATVTILRFPAPTAVCQDIIAKLDEAGTATITPAQVDNGSFDDNPLVSMSLSKESFGCADIGPNTVTLTVTNTRGNTDSCDAIVTVIDETPPTAIGKDVTLILGADGRAALTPALADGGSTDNCGISQRLVLPVIFRPYNVGSNDATLYVRDASGNEDSVGISVTVIDDLPPNLVLQESVTVDLDEHGLAVIRPLDLDAGSSDNVRIDSIEISPQILGCENLGANTVTVTIADASGNSSTGTVSVEVLDPLGVCNPALPQIFIPPLASALIRNDAPIIYAVSDRDSSAVDVEVEFATVDAEFQSATPAEGGSGTTALPVQAERTPYSFIWDSKADLGEGIFSGVRVRMRATDETAPGPWTESESFTVDNSAAFRVISLTVLEAFTEDPLALVTATLYNLDTQEVYDEKQSDGDGFMELYAPYIPVPLGAVLELEGHESRRFSHFVAPAEYTVRMVPTAPDAPVGLQAVSTPRGVLLRWEPNLEFDLSGYRVYSSTDGYAFAEITSEVIEQRRFLDASVQAETYYYYYVTAIDEDGNESASSEVAEVEAGVVLLWVGSAAAAPGGAARVPINVFSAWGISASEIEIELHYPPAWLDAAYAQDGFVSGIRVDKTAVTRHLEDFTWEIPEPGIVRIAVPAADSTITELYGEGHLFDVWMQVNADAEGECEALHLRNVQLFDAEGQALTVRSGLREAQLCLSESCRLGDMNGDGSFTIEDVAFALRFAVGLETPTDCQLQAGDINGDGHLDSADAVMLARLIASLPINPSTKDFQVKSLVDKQDAPALVLETTEALLGQSVDVSLYLDNAAAMAGCDFTIAFPLDDVVVLQSVSLGEAASGYDYEEDSGQGYITFSIANTLAWNAEGETVLAVFTFQVAKTATVGETIPIRFTDADLKDEYGGSFSWTQDISTQAGGIATKSAILAGSISCILYDSVTETRITNGTVSLSPAEAPPVSTNREGTYIFPSLSQGFYLITATAQGYKSIARSQTLGAGEFAVVNMPMTVDDQFAEGETEGEETEGEGESSKLFICGPDTDPAKRSYAIEMLIPALFVVFLAAAKKKKQ